MDGNMGAIQGLKSYDFYLFLKLNNALNSLSL